MWDFLISIANIIWLALSALFDLTKILGLTLIKWILSTWFYVDGTIFCCYYHSYTIKTPSDNIRIKSNLGIYAELFWKPDKSFLPDRIPFHLLSKKVLFFKRSGFSRRTTKGQWNSFPRVKHIDKTKAKHKLKMKGFFVLCYWKCLLLLWRLLFWQEFP